MGKKLGVEKVRRSALSVLRFALKELGVIFLFSKSFEPLVVSFTTKDKKCNTKDTKEDCPFSHRLTLRQSAQTLRGAIAVRAFVF